MAFPIITTVLAILVLVLEFVASGSPTGL